MDTKKHVSRRQLLMGWREALKEEDKREQEAREAAARKETELRETLSAARAAVERDELPQAVELFRTVLRAKSQDDDARQELGLCLYALGQYIQARVEFERVLRNRKHDNTAALFLGLCLLHQSKVDKALAAWEGFTPSGPREEALAAVLAGQAVVLRAEERPLPERVQQALAAVGTALAGNAGSPDPGATA